MIIRQITLATDPPRTVILHYDSRSNAEKAPEIVEDATLGKRIVFKDDYKQVFSVRDANDILDECIQDVGEEFRASGEMEIGKMIGQVKFDERIDKDPVLKAFATKKRMQQMTRVAVPPGIQP